MQKNKSHKQLIPLLKSAVGTLVSNPIILYPLSIGIFIQLLTLEILYFIPRFPLVIFFGPVVRRIWAEAFLHYPFNFFLLPKLFYYAQIAIYILIGGFLSAIAISIITALNNNEKASFKASLRNLLPSYIHVFLASLLSFTLFNILSVLYGKFSSQLMMSKEKTGIFLFLKKIMYFSEPYINLIVGVIVTTILVFVIPVIVIEKKKITDAVWLNFKQLKKSFLFIFAVAFIPTLLYIPVFLLRNNTSGVANSTLPEIQLVLIILGILMTFLIDTVIFTAATIYYLSEKEQE